MEHPTAKHRTTTYHRSHSPRALSAHSRYTKSTSFLTFVEFSQGILDYDLPSCWSYRALILIACGTSYLLSCRHHRATSPPASFLCRPHPPYLLPCRFLLLNCIMLESSRRRILSALNSRYIYGRLVCACSLLSRLLLDDLRSFSTTVTDPATQQPLLHTIIFIIEMAITMRLVAKFNSYYAGKPVLTTMITNAVRPNPTIFPPKTKKPTHFFPDPRRHS